MVNVKVKIIKPAIIGGAIHRPNKLGNVAEMDEKHADILIKRGFAEKASDKTPVTPGVTVKPNMPPMIVNIETGDPAPGSEGAKLKEERDAEKEKGEKK